MSTQGSMHLQQTSNKWSILNYMLHQGVHKVWKKPVCFTWSHLKAQSLHNKHYSTEPSEMVLFQSFLLPLKLCTCPGISSFSHQAWVSRFSNQTQHACWIQMGGAEER